MLLPCRLESRVKPTIVVVGAMGSHLRERRWKPVFHRRRQRHENSTVGLQRKPQNGEFPRDIGPKKVKGHVLSLSVKKGLTNPQTLPLSP